jgi:hypothetical protein
MLSNAQWFIITIFNRRNDSRLISESAPFGRIGNRCKRIGDDGNEKLDQPKVKDDHTGDEKQARFEKIGIHSLPHHGGPIVCCLMKIRLLADQIMLRT